MGLLIKSGPIDQIIYIYSFYFMYSDFSFTYYEGEHPFIVQLMSPSDVFVDTSLQVFRETRMESAYLFRIDSQQGYCKSRLFVRTSC